MATTPVFSDEQIASILDLINTTRHTQYIGARYVPIFGRKNETSIEWDNSKPYEPLTIVLYQGNSYTSRQYVPAGTNINNIDFWANTGNYNAQIEQYRQEVAQFDTRITEAATTANNAMTLAHTNENNISRNDGEITEINNNLEALGADTVPKSTAINKQLKGLAPDKYAPNTHAIFIGDSITEGWNGTSDNQWTTRLCDTFKWSGHNYAVGGTGFNPLNSKNFEWQVNQAIADTTYNHTDVSYIFVSGGINDGAPTNDTRTACLNTAQNICTKLKNNFPNAKIYSVIGLCALLDPNKHPTSTTPLGKRISYFHSLARIFITNNVPCIGNAWRWLLTNTTYSDDGLHPNDFGYNIIQAYYEEIVKNTYSDPTYETSNPTYSIQKTSDNVTNIAAAITNTADTSTIFGDINYVKNTTHPLADGDRISDNGNTIDLKIAELPPHLRSPYDTYFPVLCTINNGYYQGHVKLVYDFDGKKQYIMLHVTIPTYNFGTNDWNLTLHLNKTIPIYGIVS